MSLRAQGHDLFWRGTSCMSHKTVLLLVCALVAGWVSGVSRMSSLPLTATAAASSQASAAGSDDIFHVAIFRFPKERLSEAMAAFRELAAASRHDPGNLGYNIYRGTDDDQAFYVVEHWASPASLAAHERTEAFVHFGQGVLARFATLHDAVTARAFDIG
jgi:quinol monooxygenase YgiN